ncbi:MAG: hypothetical protein FWC24_06550 [Treponema sp.]|nr:hypothetical protein [Treponema sp.]
MKESLLSKLYSKLPIINTERKKAQQAASERKLPILKLVIFIVDWHKANDITDVFDEEKVRMHFITRGRGTAYSEVLDLLGIGTTEKAVALCLEQAVLIPVLMKEAQKKFGLHNPGAGIVFTVPVTGINTPILRSYKPSVLKNEKIALHRREQMTDETAYELIISIINHGFSDEFMKTARMAGASGGTIINARGSAHEGVVKFFGISVQEEKEIIIILTTNEKKTAIMRAVCEAHGLNSPANGMVFSLPVDDVMGLSLD